MSRLRTTVSAVPLAAALIVLVLAACRMPTTEPSPAVRTPSTSRPSAGDAAEPAAAEPERFTPLIITPIAPDPVPVTATDGRTHVVYELEVLNASPRPATISAVETLAGGSNGPVIATRKGDQVVASSILVGDYALPPLPAKVVPPAGPSCWSWKRCSTTGRRSPRP